MIYYDLTAGLFAPAQQLADGALGHMVSSWLAGDVLPTRWHEFQGRLSYLVLNPRGDGMRMSVVELVVQSLYKPAAGRSLGIGGVMPIEDYQSGAELVRRWAMLQETLVGIHERGGSGYGCKLV